jgi:hypothetical protein
MGKAVWSETSTGHVIPRPEDARETYAREWRERRLAELNARQALWQTALAQKAGEIQAGAQYAELLDSVAGALAWSVQQARLQNELIVLRAQSEAVNRAVSAEREAVMLGIIAAPPLPNAPTFGVAVGRMRWGG